MELFKAGLITLGGALLGLTISLGANAADRREGGWHATGHTAGEWQGQGQAADELNQNMNQEQKCCPAPVHKPHTKHHEEQFLGGHQRVEWQHITTKNTIETTTKEEADNQTNGCVDTEKYQNKIEKKCAPCDK